MTSALVSLAQTAPAAPGGGGAGGQLQMLLPMVLIFGVFYLLIIRPQQKKTKLHQQMINELKAGDLVVTSGGVIGKITGVRDPEVVIEVSQGVRLRVLRSAISNKHTPGEPAAKADAKAS